MTGLRVILAAACLAVSVASAQAKCADDYNSKYGSGLSHKAFAMTMPGSALRPGYKGPAFSCAWATNKPTLQLALQTALTICESMRIRSDRRGRCRVVARQ